MRFTLLHVGDNTEVLYRDCQFLLVKVQGLRDLAPPILQFRATLRVRHCDLCGDEAEGHAKNKKIIKPIVSHIK